MSKMVEEIRQQPTALEKTIRLELRGFEKLRQRFAAKPPRLVVLAARGTSDNAAQFGRYLIEVTTGIPVSLAAPSVSTLYHSKLKLGDCLLVGISQSGESTDTNVVLEEGRERGAYTIGITNERESSMAKLADHTVLVRAGHEKSVAATKTYTGQLAVFYLLAWALGAGIDLDDVRRLPAWAEAALKLEAAIVERAERFRFMNHAVAIGRGLNYANAFEWALKLMETCYIVAERFSQADILHGPIAMVDASLPAFLLTPPGESWPVMKDLVVRLNALKAESLCITDTSNREAAELGRALVIPVKLAHRGALPVDVYTPVPYIIPAQLFAAALAEVKGLDADAPRGLSKVTLTL
jgi:glucosamine--fructose-6-phosphate aminotransferase (isomerizing)